MDIRKRIFGLTCEKNSDSVIVSCNDVFLEYAGVNTDSKVIGFTDLELCWQDRAHLYRQHELDALAGNNYSTFIPLKLKNGDEALFMHTKSQKKDASGNVLGINCHSVEIINPNINHLFNYLMHQSPQDNYTFCLNKQMPEYGLTKREKEVLFFIAKGKTAKAIGKAIDISPKTVACHMERIKKKLNCRTKSEVIDKAYHLGFSQLVPSSLPTEKIHGILTSD